MKFIAVVFWWLIVMCIPYSYCDSGAIILFLYVRYGRLVFALLVSSCTYGGLVIALLLLFLLSFPSLRSPCTYPRTKTWRRHGGLGAPVFESVEC